MALTFKLASHASLPTGGPVAYTLSNEAGFEIGRDQVADWRLPDPDRIVSGRHCQIKRQGDDYVLIDLSTNGTYVNGATSRVQSPYRLKDGDLVQIGEYYIRVSITGDPEPRETMTGEAAVRIDRPETAKSLWDVTGEVAPPPSDPRELRPRGPAIPVHGDFLSYHFNAPHVSDARQFTPAASSLPSSPVAPPETARAPEPRRRAVPADNVWSSPADALARAEAPPEPAPAPPRSEPASPLPVSPRPGGGDDAFLRGFMAACSLDAKLPTMEDPEAFGALLGQFVLSAIGETQRLLRARGEAKMAARTSEHTLIQPQDNNPLKFTPTPEEALRIMFGPKTKTYLDAGRAIEAGFADLQRHQIQTFAAMQQALQCLLNELDPARIETQVEKPQGAGALFTSRKTQLWDAYVAAWRAQAAGQADGVVGRFMALFGKFYDRAGAE